MAAPRRDTKGIVDAAELFSHVRFRRREPAEPLRPYLEHYWLIDWDLPEPYASHVVPHPSVNVVFQFQRSEAPAGSGDVDGTDGPDGPDGPGAPGAPGAPGTSPADGFGEVAGIGLELFTKKLEGVGRACGVQFRPGGFRPFAPARPVSDWTGRQVPLDEVFPAGAADGAAPAVLTPDDEDARVAALDAFLLSLGPRPDPQADLAMALVDHVRADRSMRRVDQLARTEGLSTRSLQRLFSAYVGVGPKWVILRYRIHDALDVAASGTAVDWAAVAADLGYADQAHLVRDFTTTVGVPPTAYAAGA
ncbi:helix-turn-helix domain-containing protein [Streptomyces sp. LHD-70]|uniref:AraC family transcriptional regulator n=1 Tax=Streptomyces sp. LHD-70 TaxID=3072140 RepID=UPI00280E57E0|nr:helix-turn-helix domain-containing protein [Streptomyces sp. LHD-70]MDQ8708180.1 helix-turn-helix domain-containing protein [Streptomyces sp. LHD-70]